MTPPTLAEAIRAVKAKLARSLRMDRTGEPFFLEQDEAIHDLEALARRAEGEVSREIVSERRIG